MKKVLVPLAQGCEELEAVTIIDLLRRAEIEVVTASLGETTIVASRGVKLIADAALSEVEADYFDMIVLPGGLPGADYLQGDSRINTILNRILSDGGFVGAICAAPKVLAHANILDGKTITAYPGVLDAIDSSGFVASQEAVVIDGKIITSRGPGTAMDFALQLIQSLVGVDVRHRVEQELVR
jgi:protein deglycase